ncbi:hypothetical protein [Caudoviricetes sp.]|nr:hypothetical protein [Caudoviricetes sp.]
MLNEQIAGHVVDSLSIELESYSRHYMLESSNLSAFIKQSLIELADLGHTLSIDDVVELYTEVIAYLQN